MLCLALLIISDLSRLFTFLFYQIIRLNNTIAIQTSGSQSKLRECLNLVHLDGRKAKTAQKSLFWAVPMEIIYNLTS